MSTAAARKIDLEFFFNTGSCTEMTEKTPKENRMKKSPGRSGKTNGIVLKTKMRAGRRRKLFRKETGWREPNYAGVSVF
jgi:hypothetical protein